MLSRLEVEGCVWASHTKLPCFVMLCYSQQILGTRYSYQQVLGDIENVFYLAVEEYEYVSLCVFLFSL